VRWGRVISGKLTGLICCCFETASRSKRPSQAEHGRPGNYFRQLSSRKSGETSPLTSSWSNSGQILTAHLPRGTHGNPGTSRLIGSSLLYSQDMQMCVPGQDVIRGVTSSCPTPRAGSSSAPPLTFPVEGGMGQDGPRRAQAPSTNRPFV